jgi:hypothetical protein
MLLGDEGDGSSMPVTPVLISDIILLGHFTSSNAYIMYTNIPVDLCVVVEKYESTSYHTFYFKTNFLFFFYSPAKSSFEILRNDTKQKFYLTGANSMDRELWVADVRTCIATLPPLILEKTKSFAVEMNYSMEKKTKKNPKNIKNLPQFRKQLEINDQNITKLNLSNSLKIRGKKKKIPGIKFYYFVPYRSSHFSCNFRKK